ncbi:MAG: PAS fold protein [Methanobacterium sp. PtaU1.Bin242]|nr:MAG: PAS fold protein [Methanobacterium sp. PtaU1.Bin242]
MESKLIESEKFYRKLFENMLEGFAHCKVIFDEQGNPVDWIFLDVNSSFERLTGLENIIGKRVMEAIPSIKDVNPELFEICCRVALTGRSEIFEIFIKPIEIWLNISVFSPAKEHFVVVFNDFTDNKVAEERIERLYRLYATLSQINQSVVRIKDKKELFETICKVCVEFGKFRMAWIGLIDENGNIRPVAHSGYEDGYLDKITINVKDKPSLNRPTTLAVNNGKVTIIEDVKKELYREWSDDALLRGYRSLAVIPLKLKGDVVGNLYIYASEPDFFNEDEIDLAEEIGTDISYAMDSIESEKELEIANKALSESERSYRELVDNSMVAVYKSNLQGQILFANDAMAKIFHFKSVKDLKEINVINLYSDPADREKILEKLKKEVNIGQYELKMKSNTGEIINIILSANLSDGMISGMMMDITRRKEAEKKIQTQYHIIPLKVLWGAVIAQFFH